MLHWLVDIMIMSGAPKWNSVVSNIFLKSLLISGFLTHVDRSFCSVTKLIVCRIVCYWPQPQSSITPFYIWRLRFGIGMRRCGGRGTRLCGNAVYDEDFRTNVLSRFGIDSCSPCSLVLVESWKSNLVLVWEVLNSSAGGKVGFYYSKIIYPLLWFHKSLTRH